MIKFVATLAVIGVVTTNPTCPVACPASWVPVCGSDGVTYFNACNFECAQTRDRNLLKKQDGECPLPVEEPEQPTCACTKDLRPVCGNDLKTYNNICLLECAQKGNQRLAKSYDGECIDNTVQPEPKVCVCTLNYLPVCGSDGKTYSNECSFNCAANENRSLVKKSDGQCQEAPVCVCTLLWAPVCGNDGKTYSNECSLNCEKAANRALVKMSDGECPTERVQVVDYPVDNVADPEQSDGVVVVDGPEDVVDQPPSEEVVVVNQPETVAPPLVCPCPYNYAPVCGTNGVTYDNQCMLNCAQGQDPTINLRSQGSCGQAPPTTTSCPCTRELEQFCGTDGKTYNNRCLLECAANQTKTDLKVAYSGACQQPCVCTRNIKKVCGTDGKTYSNQCLLECEAKNTRTDIAVRSAGPCPASDPCVCTRIFKQVCGTDGVTYDNECLLGCEAATSKKDIRVKSSGTCEN